MPRDGKEGRGDEHARPGRAAARPGRPPVAPTCGSRRHGEALGGGVGAGDQVSQRRGWAEGGADGGAGLGGTAAHPAGADGGPPVGDLEGDAGQEVRLWLLAILAFLMLAEQLLGYRLSYHPKSN